MIAPSDLALALDERRAALRQDVKRKRRDVCTRLCDTATTAQEGLQMDTTTALARFEAAISDQLVIAGDDPAVDSAARSLLAGLGPATRQLAFDLAEQAAAEVAAQLPEQEVDVVLREGEPVLAVRNRPSGPASQPDEDYDARITLRLPPTLKRMVENAAGSTGESVNGWVVDALSGAASRNRGPGRRVQGRVRT